MKIGYKPPVEIELASGEKVKVAPFMNPYAFYTIRETFDDKTKQFDEKKFTPEVVNHFLKNMLVEPFTDEDFKASNFLDLVELVGKVLKACPLPKETVSSLKSPPTKP